MKNSQNNTVTNIKVVCLGKNIRPSSTRPDQLVYYINMSVGADITGKRNGKKVRFEYISGKGFGWVEV